MRSQILLILLGLLSLGAGAGLQKRSRLAPYGGGLSNKNPYGSGGPPLKSTSNYEQPQSPPEVEEEEEYEAPVAPIPKAPSSHGYSSGSYGHSSSPNYNSKGSSSGYGSASSQAENEKIAYEQAKSAKYSFASAVNDGISDQSQVRQEVRDGLKVTGSYSYTDGYFKRTVEYEADENGYRVINEHNEPIGDGPLVDHKGGKADVHTQIQGVDTQYSITAHDIPEQKGFKELED